MAFKAGKGAKVLHKDVELSSYFNQVSTPAEAQALETTTFGAGGGARTFISGLKNGSVSLSGFWDGAVDAVDEELNAVLGTGAAVVTVGLSGLAIGDVAKLVSSLATRYQTQAATDGVVQVTAEVQADAGGVEGGVSLHDVGLESAIVNSASVDNLASSASGAVAHLHVTAAVALTTATIKVQHSVDNVVWVDLITFTAVTARTSERLTVTGTVNRYTRSALTVLTGTSITYAVAFARR